MILVAANLRPAASSVGPVVDQLTDDLGLSTTAAAALLTLPVLCFGALAPVAALLARRNLGLLLATGTVPLLWPAILGVGQGACFPLALTMIVLRSGGVGDTARVSAMVQSGGYLIAAAVPLAAGALHQATRSWTVPLAVLLGLTVPQLLAGVAAGRNRLIRL